MRGSACPCPNLEYRAQSERWKAGDDEGGDLRRVSTDEQSPEAQLRELRVYAEHRGFHISREYVDQASGDVRNRRRAPEFEALMADARRRRFDCVLVWKYDRFARTLGALIAALLRRAEGGGP